MYADAQDRLGAHGLDRARIERKQTYKLAESSSLGHTPEQTPQGFPVSDVYLIPVSSFRAPISGQNSDSART